MTFLRRLLARLWQWLHPASSPGLDPEENAVVRALLAPELDPEVNTETPSLPTPGTLLLECRWDPSNQQDCQDALSLFNSLRTHKSIYRLTETGQRAEYLQAFDGTLGRMGVFAQRTQWDHIREATDE